MKTSECSCGNRLFFNNHQCLACGRQVGRCDHCHALSSFTRLEAGTLRCDQSHCRLEVVACDNRSRFACNSFVTSCKPGICQWCELTKIIPDLSQPANVARWSALEAAKRRLLIGLEQLGLPPYVGNMRDRFPLQFQFLAPTIQPDGSKVPVITGHAEGTITINIEEADSARREATRVALGEPQRTLIGHMRHEIGHYIDWSYAFRIAKQEYIELFGDPEAVDYAAAQQRHYSSGPPSDWSRRYVSAYASMHPWEDFAETTNAYLDMMAICETATDQGLAIIDTSPQANIAEVVTEALRIAIAISEFNSDLGLQLLLPEQLPEPTIAKLEYVHQLRLPETRRKMLAWLAANDEEALAEPMQPRA